MISWFKNVRDTVTKWLDNNPPNSEFDAEEARISALSIQQAQTEVVERLEGSAADYEKASLKSGLEHVNLAPGVMDIFDRYNWITFHLDVFRIDRALVRSSEDNPDFIQIGKTDDHDLFVMKEHEGIFSTHEDVGYEYFTKDVLYISVFHALLVYMYVFE
jgi:hypothetical protein